MQTQLENLKKVKAADILQKWSALTRKDGEGTALDELLKDLDQNLGLDNWGCMPEDLGMALMIKTKEMVNLTVEKEMEDEL